ncbi:hypothetical protein QVA66_02230 [Staphylococcus chromogenes]|nr:hypothetical protein [Staphylococcus chromogenes]
MMIAALISALAAFACIVLGVVTGNGTWYLATIGFAAVGLVLWAVDWARGRSHRQ